MVIHYTNIYNNVVFPDKKACIFRFKGRKSCANGDSGIMLCWLAAMLDLRENRAFAMEGFMGMFNCGQEGYKRTDFR